MTLNGLAATDISLNNCHGTILLFYMVVKKLLLENVENLVVGERVRVGAEVMDAALAPSPPTPSLSHRSLQFHEESPTVEH